MSLFVSGKRIDEGSKQARTEGRQSETNSTTGTGSNTRSRLLFTTKTGETSMDTTDYEYNGLLETMSIPQLVRLAQDCLEAVKIELLDSGETNTAHRIEVLRKEVEFAGLFL